MSLLEKKNHIISESQLSSFYNIWIGQTTKIEFSISSIISYFNVIIYQKCHFKHISRVKWSK